MNVVIGFAYFCQASNEFASNVCNFSQMVGFKDLTFCGSVHAGWIYGDIVKGCFKCNILCTSPKWILWCPIL